MIAGVYLILDPDAVKGRDATAVANAALQGGVAAIQWRQKGGSIRERWSQILAVRTLCTSRGVPFLINDRVDIALGVGADGVHLGQNDLPLNEARRLMSHAILGMSVTHASQLDAAIASRPDYLGVGPIFATASKFDAATPTGLELILVARQRTDIPLAAIGGITAKNAPAVFKAGADAIAVISAICAGLTILKLLRENW